MNLPQPAIAARPVLVLRGGFSLRSSTGAPLEISSRKEKFLLARLALEAGHSLSRDQLCGFLWADRAEEQARASLRQALSSLRAVLGGAEIIQSRHDRIWLELTLIDVDVAPASDGLLSARYRIGDLLLDGVMAPSSDVEDWLRAEQLKLEDKDEQLIIAASTAPAVSEAVLAAATSIFSRSPCREGLCRALMRMHAAAGNRNKALAIYRDCVAALKNELAVTPELETEQLYRDVLMNKLGSPPFASNADGTQRPVVAVMPLSILGGDPSLTMIGDGLAEDLVTGLGRFRQVDVIDRNSSAAVAKRTEDAQEVGKLLGVDYVVQGSIVSVGSTMRITVRLVNTATRTQVWAEQLTCAADDLPGLPAQVSMAITVRLQSRLELSLIEQAQRKTTLAAYDCLLRGIKHLRGYGADDNQRAIEWFEKALAQDPDYPLARAYRAFADVVDNNYGDAPPGMLHGAKSAIKRALSDEPNDSRIHWLLGLVCGCLADFQGEVQAYKRALEINPNDANILASYGLALSVVGRFDEGIGHIHEAMRLNPFHPEYYWVDLGCAFFSAQRFEDAIEALNHRSFPKPYVLGRLAASYALLGRKDEAAKTVAEILRQQPDFKISSYRMSAWDEKTRALLHQGMKLAGIAD